MRDLSKIYKWMRRFNEGDVNSILVVGEHKWDTLIGLLEKLRFNKGKNRFTGGMVDKDDRPSSYLVSAGSTDTFKKRFSKLVNGDDGGWCKA